MDEEKVVKTITMKQIEELLGHVVDGRLGEKVDKRIADVTEGTHKDMEAHLAEVKEIGMLLRESYNRDSRNRPFKSISQDTKDYIDHVWRPSMAKDASRGIFADPVRIKEIIQRTTSTVSTEGDDVQGGSRLGPP